jgi:uncharacterized protein YjbI with pentapeptide repeats
LMGAVFDGCDLRNADFRDAALLEASFVDADLSRAQFSSSAPDLPNSPRDVSDP